MSYKNSYCLALCGFYSVREADASTTLKLQRYPFNFPPTLLNSIAGPGSLIFSSLSYCDLDHENLFSRNQEILFTLACMGKKETPSYEERFFHFSLNELTKYGALLIPYKFAAHQSLLYCNDKLKHGLSILVYM